MSSPPSSSQASFTADMERRAYRFFIDQADPKTGLVKDRASNFGKDEYHVASIAATGFGLAALVIGAERGYLPKEEAYGRTLRTLRFLMHMPQEHGWMYHFVEMKTGERAWNCELSSIDTALLLCGVLASGNYFHNTEVDGLAHRIYERVDFDWMRTDGGQKPDELLLSMGWTPEKGFIPSRWSGYSEHLFLYLLALSSPTHPIPAASWNAWERREETIGPYKALGIHLPLFVHQYVHCWVDLNGRPDGDGRDYWKNSVDATLANRWYCIHRAGEMPGFGPNGWGLSAGDSPDGYRAFAPAPNDNDGTLFPIGLEAAVAFAPEESLTALLEMKRQYGNHLWGKYGFSPFNAKRHWFGPDMIGIDAGAALLMLDSYLHKDPFIPRLLERAALSKGLKIAGFGKPVKRAEAKKPA